MAGGQLRRYLPQPPLSVYCAQKRNPPRNGSMGMQRMFERCYIWEVDVWNILFRWSSYLRWIACLNFTILMLHVWDTLLYRVWSGCLGGGVDIWERSLGWFGRSRCLSCSACLDRMMLRIWDSSEACDRVEVWDELFECSGWSRYLRWIACLDFMMLTLCIWHTLSYRGWSGCFGGEVDVWDGLLGCSGWNRCSRWIEFLDALKLHTSDNLEA